MGMVNEVNRSQQSGNLVVEIVPADKPGCSVGQPPRPAAGTYDYGRCTGAGVPTPRVGAHVSVTGPYVLDSFHGWTEIHPAWAVTSMPSPSATSPVPPTTTASRPAARTPGGAYYANCDAARAAGAAPLNQGEPGYRPALDRDSDGVACE